MTTKRLLDQGWIIISYLRTDVNVTSLQILLLLRESTHSRSLIQYNTLTDVPFKLIITLINSSLFWLSYQLKRVLDIGCQKQYNLKRFKRFTVLTLLTYFTLQPTECNYNKERLVIIIQLKVGHRKTSINLHRTKAPFSVSKDWSD